MKGVNFVSCLEVKPQFDGVKENGLEESTGIIETESNRRINKSAK
jgi:hypothetical protein